MPEHFLSNKLVYVTPVCPNSQASLSIFSSHHRRDLPDRAVSTHSDITQFSAQVHIHAIISSKQGEEQHPGGVIMTSQGAPLQIITIEYRYVKQEAEDLWIASTDTKVTETWATQPEPTLQSVV